jgi:hypothetical protein
MELVGQSLFYEYSKSWLAGAGTQTAALAFGGYDGTFTGTSNRRI